MQKGRFLCQEVMVQVPLVKARAQVVVWAEARDKAEAGWAGRLPPGREETAFVLIVEQPHHTLQVSPATK